MQIDREGRALAFPSRRSVFAVAALGTERQGGTLDTVVWRTFHTLHQVLRAGRSDPPWDCDVVTPLVWANS